jgi:DNA polymerase III alpha subunit
MATLPLFKSHYSLGKSILTVEEPSTKKGEPVENSIFHILKSNNLSSLTLVEDSITGLLQTSKVAADNKIKLNFGLRMTLLDNMEDKSEESLKEESKYIIFVKNNEGYKDLIKIWSKAATDGFYYIPRLSFKALKELWNNKNLKLAIPFYDSFLHLNSLEFYNHVPDFSFVDNVTFFKEENGIPFDFIIREKVDNFCDMNNYPTLETQSIFYKDKKDFIAYLAFRALNNRSTLECPRLNHLCSDTFNFERWFKNNK